LSETPTTEFIALYGSLMRGLGAMNEIAVAPHLRYVGPCVIDGQLFDLGAYPGLRIGSGRVIGEMHALLDPIALPALDRFEGFDPGAPNDSLYLRKRVELVEPAFIEAWVYVYNQSIESETRIDGGDWRAHLDQRSKG
jgi:gamma-glutamylcyclotransferase (GGCT)/AIG2-like uncharacterized protein YtfP